MDYINEKRKKIFTYLFLLFNLGAFGGLVNRGSKLLSFLLLEAFTNFEEGSSSAEGPKATISNPTSKVVLVVSIKCMGQC